MTRISIGIDFCTTEATVTGTVCSPRPRPPPAPPAGPTPGLGRASPPQAAAVSANRDMRTASRMWKIYMLLRLLEPQRIDRVERGGLSCRIEPEEDADRGRESERDGDRVSRHGRGPALPHRDSLGERKPKGDPDAAAEQA